MHINPNATRSLIDILLATAEQLKQRHTRSKTNSQRIGAAHRRSSWEKQIV